MAGDLDQLVEWLGGIRDDARSSQHALLDRERQLRGVIQRIEALGGRGYPQRQEAARAALRCLHLVREALTRTEHQASDALAKLQGSGMVRRDRRAVAESVSQAGEEVSGEVGDAAETAGGFAGNRLLSAVGDAVRDRLRADHYWSAMRAEAARDMQLDDLASLAFSRESFEVFLVNLLASAGVRAVLEATGSQGSWSVRKPAEAGVGAAGGWAAGRRSRALRPDVPRPMPGKDNPPKLVADLRRGIFDRVQTTSGVRRGAWTVAYGKVMELTDPTVVPARIVATGGSLAFGVAIGVLAGPGVGAVLAAVIARSLIRHGGWVLRQDAKRRAGLA